MAQRTRRARANAAGPAAGVAQPRTDVVTVEASRCRKCGSTERTGYGHTREHAYAGLYDGKPYTHVVWRRTSCAKCGQVRDDRTLENRA
jgi:hypothetical protein